MNQYGIGQPVRRVEDRRFVTGRGSYVDDLVRPRQAYAYMLRSPHAHARIRALDTAAAAAAPEVLAVLTGEDVARDGLGPIPCLSAVTNRDGSTSPIPPRPAMVRDRVRHVGDTVAMVVAESLAAARDAAELIEVDYEPLPAVVETAACARSGPADGVGLRRRAISPSTGGWATRPRSSGRWRRRATGSASNSSTTASSSIRWSRAAPSANTIRARMPTPCGARPRARIFCAICWPRASSRSRKTASGW